MSNIDKQTIEKLIHLSRINCSEEEKDHLQKDLERILSYIEQLQEVDTENTSPCNQILEDIGNVFREDIVGEILPRELFLANAPSQVGGMIKTPPVLKSS